MTKHCFQKELQGPLHLEHLAWLFNMQITGHHPRPGKNLWGQDQEIRILN